MNTGTKDDDDMGNNNGSAGMSSGGMNSPGQPGAPDEMPEATSNPSRKSGEQMGH